MDLRKGWGAACTLQLGSVQNLVLCTPSVYTTDTVAGYCWKLRLPFITISLGCSERSVWSQGNMCSSVVGCAVITKHWKADFQRTSSNHASSFYIPTAKLALWNLFIFSRSNNIWNIFEHDQVAVHKALIVTLSLVKNSPEVAKQWHQQVGPWH